MNYNGVDLQFKPDDPADNILVFAGMGQDNFALAAQFYPDPLPMKVSASCNFQNFTTSVYIQTRRRS